MEEMREASSIDDQLFQTPAPLGDASTLTTADTDKDLTLTDQERMIENDGFGDDDGLGKCGCSTVHTRSLHVEDVLALTLY